MYRIKNKCKTCSSLEILEQDTSGTIYLNKIFEDSLEKKKERKWRKQEQNFILQKYKNPNTKNFDCYWFRINFIRAADFSLFEQKKQLSTVVCLSGHPKQKWSRLEYRFTTSPTGDNHDIREPSRTFSIVIPSWEKQKNLLIRSQQKRIKNPSGPSVASHCRATSEKEI